MKSCINRHRNPSAVEDNYKPAPYIAVPKSDAERSERKIAFDAGLAHIKAAKTAAFVVAGGAGFSSGDLMDLKAHTFYHLSKASLFFRYTQRRF